MTLSILLSLALAAPSPALIGVCATDFSGRYVFSAMTRDRSPLQGFRLEPLAAKLTPNTRAVNRTLSDSRGRKLSTWVYIDAPPPRPPFRQTPCGRER